MGEHHGGRPDRHHETIFGIQRTDGAPCRLPAGSLLSGAVFEIYNTTGNLLDKIVSDNRGIAGSKGLPTDAARAPKVVTGTYSERMYY